MITFDKNGADGTETMEPQIIEAGTTANLTQNVYTNTGYVFASWNTEATPTEQTPGTSYPDQAEYQAEASQSADVTLHAQWIVPRYLYNEVKNLVKKSGDTERTQTLAQMQEAITAPDTTDPSTDTSNSGVYKYDAAKFGTASDASNDYTIYYYRGILEPTADQGSYGSDGKATTYPNYVRLGNNTCWRIVRTTGSGGVKMIYNGVWTGSTCANSTNDARLADIQTFASKGTSTQSWWYYNIHYVGYTFNNDVTDSATDTSVDTVFGSDANPSLNNTRSNIKTYIEDTWYAHNMTGYTNILESSAGYCNDRTAYSNNTTKTTLTTIVPYERSGADMYFGAYGRNQNATKAGKTPSLTCSRSTVDLYRYIAGSTGIANELKYPAAMLTADEASLAGSGIGSTPGASSYNTKSYLSCGRGFWFLSPSWRFVGVAMESVQDSTGYLRNNQLNEAYGVRPAISLNHETTVKDGSGTATDPWTINE